MVELFWEHCCISKLWFFQPSHNMVQNLGGGRDIWTNFIERLSNKAWGCIWWLTSKCFSWHPIIYCWQNVEKAHGIIHTYSANYEFPTTNCPPTLLLVSPINQHHFINTWLNKYLTPNSLGRHHGVYHNAKPMTSQHHKNYLHLKDFLNYKCASYLKQPLTLLPPCKKHRFIFHIKS
jgi:hypothetical protein